MVSVVFALRHEAAPFLRLFPASETVADAPCWARVRGELLILQTGVGPKRMERALAWLLPRRPRLVVSAGYSGALTDQHGVGDIIAPSEVIDDQGNCWPTGQWSGTGGRILSLPRLIGKPEEKRHLGNTHRALAVDMETAVVARMCRQQQVPFTCLRVISDGVDDHLSPDLLALLSGANLALGKLSLLMLRSPARILEMLRLARNARRAARRLAGALAEMIRFAN